MTVYDVCEKCGQLDELNRSGLCLSCWSEREPSDDDIYNRPGVEGGIGYPLDEPAYGEHDWRL